MDRFCDHSWHAGHVLGALLQKQCSDLVEVLISVTVKHKSSGHTDRQQNRAQQVKGRAGRARAAEAEQ